MKRNIFLLASLGLAVLAGGVFAFGYVEVTKTVPVVVANSSITMNSPVTPDELTTKQVPAAFARQIGALTSETPLISQGRFLNVSAKSGEPITQSMLSDSTDIQGALTSYAQAHNEQGVLMQLPVGNALEGLVQPGMNVGIVVNQPNGNNNTTTPVIVGPIQVLSVLGGGKAASGSSSSSATMLLFIPNNEFAKVGGQIISNQVQVILFPTGGTLPGGNINVPNATVAATQTSSKSVSNGTPMGKSSNASHSNNSKSNTSPGA